MADVTVIDLWPRWSDCWACGEPTPSRWGLAINQFAELVDNDDAETEWGGVPACQRCFQAHADGLLTADNQEQWRHRCEREAWAMQAAFAVV